MKENHGCIQTHTKDETMAVAPKLDETVEFAENPEPRCPCVLLLDTSSSMRGAPIEALNEGLRVFKTDLMHDALAVKRVEVAGVTFDSGVKVTKISGLSTTSRRQR